jgi:hypothetical protein
LSTNRVARPVEFSEDIYVDPDATGVVVGVELLDLNPMGKLGIGDKWWASFSCCQLLVAGHAEWAQTSLGYRVPLGARDTDGGNVALPAPGTAVHPHGANRQLGDDSRLPAHQTGHSDRVQESHQATSSHRSQSGELLSVRPAACAAVHSEETSRLLRDTSTRIQIMLVTPRESGACGLTG